ncbi:hypothetical protein ABZ615_21655 [Streptomyces sp. NPDC007325]|uniref:HEAT repeat domain-containing protein n=1 Tax=Streptomyces sp. NPDC007325 TaxID=3154588 RepID=UPI0033EC3F8B
MPMSIAGLVQLAMAEGDASINAGDRLVAAGVVALPEIVKVLSDPWGSPGRLPDVLISIYAEAEIGVVEEALKSQQLVVFQSAVRALGKRSDGQGGSLLYDRLGDPTELLGRRADIARACGDLGDPRGIPMLDSALGAGLAAPRSPDVAPVLVIEAIVALAKLGSFAAGVHLVSLLRDSYPPTVELAAKGLQIAVGSGMVDALSGCVLSGSAETRIAAVEALFLLGVPRAASALGRGLHSDDPRVRNNCRVRLNDIFGTECADDSGGVRQLEEHALAAQSRWPDTIRYRSGRPFTVERLVELVSPENLRNAEVLREIALATGLRVTGREQLQTVGGSELGRQFPQVGALYRWGKIPPLSFIFS